MADRDHLQIARVQRPPRPRRKARPGWRPPREFDDHSGHAADLDAAAEASLEEFEDRQASITDFDPKLILRFELNRRVDDDEWKRSGLTVLDSSDRHAAVVFADDDNLERFRQRLSEYAEGPREPTPEELAEQPDDEDREPSARFEGFFDAINELRSMQPEDRISSRLRRSLDEDPESTQHFDVEFWFSTDRDTREDWLSEARSRADALGGEIIDEYVGTSAGVMLARCSGDSAVVKGLSELDQVAFIDMVPIPLLERAELRDLQEVGPLEDVPSPPDEAPVIGVIDSGLQAGHVLLEPAVAEATAIHPEFGDQGEDANGHGTLVAGIALYGDVLEAARSGDFEPEFWLASVRVLGDDGMVPESVNWVKAIAEAIRYLAETWQCRVVNLSIGDPDTPYRGGKSTPLAAELDSLARQYRLVIVLATGNLRELDVDPEDEILARWPGYLVDEGRELIDPAQASTAVTVGAISQADGLSDRPAGTNVDASAVAQRLGPAPFTRRGPGVRDAIKPEFAAAGGNWCYDRTLQGIQPDPALEIVSTSNRYPDRLFETTVGTSFAAPVITHVAGRLASHYPDAGANAIRALLLQGAIYEKETLQVFEDAFASDDREMRLHQLCGYGAAAWDRCGISQDHRAVLLAQDELRPDDFHVYRVPMTPGFTEVSGPHSVSVGLAFTPPVRHRRYDYLAYQMEFQLVRGIELADVFDLASADLQDPDAEQLSAYELALRPTRTERRRGANQMGVRWSSQRPQQQFHGDWFVVVRSLNKWMPTGSDPQPYALAVSLEADRSTELYVELEAEIQIELEAQATG